ncbi:ubiquitin-protein transferase activating protein [Terramyces sp. JEL0728]|nr:ubiquitin-protein transferase activating protein [Terramyces sp. JEL0728]
MSKGTLQLVHETNEQDHISTVAFSPIVKNCAIGTEAGSLLVYDVNTNNLIHDFEDQDGVSALIWKSSTEIVTGDPDGNIVHWDIRTSKNRVIEGHHLDRVVGIAKSVDNVIATGGNGNIVNIWDDRRLDKPRLVIKSHTSAVRALAWCPWSPHILATGGGLDDGTIQIHNTVSGKLYQKFESGSQICQMLWSQHYKEILSANNCAEKQLCIYKFPEMKAIHTLPGHNVRPMHLALSPDGQTVASIGDDETLKPVIYAFVFPNLMSNQKQPRKRPLTIPTQLEVIDGIEWLTFVYTAKGVSINYKIRIDTDSVDTNSLTKEFKIENSVYPKAYCERSEYKGNRWEYETTVNEIGWKLCYLNMDILVGKRGLLQRAVDSFRNRFPDSKSRRVARVEKNMEKDNLPAAKKMKLAKKKLIVTLPAVDAAEDIQTPIQTPKKEVDYDLSPAVSLKRTLSFSSAIPEYTPQTDQNKNKNLLVVETVKESSPYQVRLNMDMNSIPENVNQRSIKSLLPFTKPQTERDRVCNNVAWKLVYLNPELLVNNIELLQRCVDVYLEHFGEPAFRPRSGKRLMETIFL